mmetsp:Transcript_29541/g.54131  ORF Transcript_29541/g.54131 Transcript_29541/m.54131 type:complete len:92 (-) Transcript_29541:308-583(-)
MKEVPESVEPLAQTPLPSAEKKQSICGAVDPQGGTVARRVQCRSAVSYFSRFLSRIVLMSHHQRVTKDNWKSWWERRLGSVIQPIYSSFGC